MSIRCESEQLVKRFTAERDLDAVRGVDLHVASGEVFGFFGPKGAGESASARILTT